MSVCSTSATGDVCTSFFSCWPGPVIGMSCSTRDGPMGMVVHRKSTISLIGWQTRGSVSVHSPVPPYDMKDPSRGDRMIHTTHHTSGRETVIRRCSTAAGQRHIGIGHGKNSPGTRPVTRWRTRKIEGTVAHDVRSPVTLEGPLKTYE